MTLILSFDISGVEPVELNRDRISNEKQRTSFLNRARQDKTDSPVMQIQIHEIGKDGRVYMLEDA